LSFFKWWKQHTTTWLIILALIQLIQVPHMIWNADMLLEEGLVSRINPILDFLLYGIDLIEIPSMILAITTLASHLKERGNNEVISKR